MWDGRESSMQTGTQKITPSTNPGDLLADLAHQALDATNGHAQASTPLTPQQQQAIVNFELGPLWQACAAKVRAQVHDATNWVF
jgi:cytochrome c peroxidase